MLRCLLASLVTFALYGCGDVALGDLPGPQTEGAIDQGSLTIDQGTSGADAGLVQADQGGFSPDQGQPDQATPQTDLGFPGPDPDQGIPAQDQGALPPDQGTLQPDQGTLPPDQGTMSPDQGPAPPCTPTWEIPGDGVDQDCDGFDILRVSPYGWDDGRSVSIAGNGSGDFVVVWDDFTSGSQVHRARGRRIGPDDHLSVSASSLDLGGVPSSDFDPVLTSVASDGAGYLAIWRHEAYNEIFGRFITADGLSTIGTGRVDIHDGGYPDLGQPRLTYAGGKYLAAFDADRDSVKVMGDVVASSAADVLHTDNNAIDDPAISAGPGGTLAVWENYQEQTIEGRLYAPGSGASGVVTTLNSDATAYSQQAYVRLASSGSHYMMVWQDKREGNWQIYGSLVSVSGTSISSTAAVKRSATLPDATRPLIAFCGQDYHLVYRQMIAGKAAFYYRRFSAAGIPYDPATLLYNTQADSIVDADLACSGHTLMLAWAAEGSDLYPPVWAMRIVN